MWLILLKIEFYDFVSGGAEGAEEPPAVGWQGASGSLAGSPESEVSSMFTVAYSWFGTPK
jgi:hypothetical protein